MQKVVGSNPIIRSKESAGNGGFYFETAGGTPAEALHGPNWQDVAHGAMRFGAS